MVEFLNIVIEGDYIYADEHDMMTDTWAKIKLHKTEEAYTFTGEMTGNMIKALWSLRYIMKSRKLQSREVIYWG